MSRIRYDPIEVGGSRAAAVPNAVYTEFETASGAVDAENFAEEGMDGRALAAHIVGERVGYVAEDVRNAATLATTAVYTQLVHNGTALRLTTPTSLMATDSLRVRARVWFETTLNDGQGLVGNFSGELKWNDGATTDRIDYSTRPLRRRALNINQHGLFMTEAWLFGPIAQIDWIELQYILAVGGTAFPSVSAIWATLFRRTEIV